MPEVESVPKTPEAVGQLYELLPGVPWNFDPGTQRPSQPDSQTAAAYENAHLAVVQIIRTDRIPLSPTPTNIASGKFPDKDYPKLTEYGSGYFLDRYGDIATGAHIALPKIPGTVSELEVIDSSGQSHPAHIVSVDSEDLAKIKLDDGATPPGMSILEPSLSLPKPHERVWALGHPYGARTTWISPGTYQQSTTIGDIDYKLYIVAVGENSCAPTALHEFVTQAPPQELRARAEYSNSTLLSVDMHIEPGNSGGPVVNAQGKVVGLVVKVKAITTQQRNFDTKATFLVPVKYLADLASSHPSYSFEYRADPSKPGYQLLTAVRDSTGNLVNYNLFPSLGDFLIERCGSPGDKTNKLIRR